MAEKRMFAKSIVDTDAFFELPVCAQLLYFHLSMQADDDGFVSSPVKITRTCGADKKDFERLVQDGYLIAFKGVVCIRHWRVNNLIRKDRYKKTYYQKEFQELILGSDGVYERKGAKKDIKENETSDGEEVNGHAPSESSDNRRLTEKGVLVNQNGKLVDPGEVRLGKVRIGKERGEVVEGSYKVPSRVSASASAPATVPPKKCDGAESVKLDEVKRFINENKLNVNAEKFYCHYSALSWKNSKGKPINWRRKLFDWHKSEKRGRGDSANPFLSINTED